MSVILINPYRYASSAPATVTDSFNRADSTTTLGTADTGQAWTAHTGTWGIISNQAYSVSGGSGELATLDFGGPDMAVLVTCAVVGVGGQRSGIVGRYTDTSNHYLAQAGTNACELFKCVAGAYTQLGAAGASFANADTLGLTVTGGSSQALKKNGSAILTTSDSALATGNRAGFRCTNSPPRYDDFSVTAA